MTRYIDIKKFHRLSNMIKINDKYNFQIKIKLFYMHRKAFRCPIKWNKGDILLHEKLYFLYGINLFNTRI